MSRFRPIFYQKTIVTIPVRCPWRSFSAAVRPSLLRTFSSPSKEKNIDARGNGMSDSRRQSALPPASKSPPAVPRAPPFYKRGWPTEAPRRLNISHFDPIPPSLSEPTPMLRGPDPRFPGPLPPNAEAPPKPPNPSPPEVPPPGADDGPKPPEPGPPHPTLPDIPSPFM